MDDYNPIDNKTMNSLIEKGLAMNVYLNGEWGSYRHTALKSGNIYYLLCNCFYATVMIVRGHYFLLLSISPYVRTSACPSLPKEVYNQCLPQFVAFRLKLGTYVARIV